MALKHPKYVDSVRKLIYWQYANLIAKIDDIPKLVLSKFLKLAYDIHKTQGTLDLKDPNMDGVLDIYDLGIVITHLIGRLSESSARSARL